MGNLCSIIDADADINYKPQAKYTPQHLGQTTACQLNASTEKRSSHSSSPDRRRPGARDAPTVTIEQQEPVQDDAQWRSPPAAAAAVDLQSCGACEQLQQQEPEVEIPTVPTNWKKGELIGIGAFGRVFTALNSDTGEVLAVKQVNFAKDEALQGRVAEHIKALEAEVQVLKTLKHENIVRYLGTEITDDSLNIFLEYVPGGSIASMLTKFGPFPEKLIRNYTAQLLRGLEYLHQRGIMHRDIKGANILVDHTGTVKLADFGASKKIEDLATVGSGSKSIRGTPYWMAPEVIKQTGHGRPADIWSLACTVIEMATGKPPWSNYTAPVAAMFQIASSKDPPPIPDNLSCEAKDFLMLCFNRVARDRANATRLLKHPFVANAQQPVQQQQQQQQLQLPTTPASNAVVGSNSSSPSGAVSSNPNRATDQRQQHGTPLNPRQSSGLMPSGNTSYRPPVASSMSTAQAGALKAARQSRASPSSQSHCSPMRQHPGHADTNAASPAGMGQRSEQAAGMPARSPMHQHQQQPRQAEQQQAKQSPQPFDTYRQQQQQAPHSQQPSIVRRSSPTPAAAPGGDEPQQEQQQNCMTLVDWNPVQEPSWLPPYQVPCTAQQQQQQANGRRQSESNTPVVQEQPQPADRPTGRRPAQASLPGAQQQQTSVPAEPEVDAPKLAAGAVGSRSSGILASSNPAAAAAAKRASLPVTSSSISSSGSKQSISSGRKPGDMRSPRSASISCVGSNGVAAAGPLANGPAGRASSAMSAGLTGGMTGGGSSILAGAGTRHKPRPAGLHASILQQQQQQQQQQAPTAPSAGSSPGRSSPSSAAVLRSSKVAGAASAGAAAAPGGQVNCQDNCLQRDAAGGAIGGSGMDEDAVMSTKRAQWENELMEELERHRQEQRATRKSGLAQRQ